MQRASIKYVQSLAHDKKKYSGNTRMVTEMKWQWSELEGERRDKDKERAPDKKASSAYKTHTHAKLARLQRNDFCSTTQK